MKICNSVLNKIPWHSYPRETISNVDERCEFWKLLNEIKIV